MKLELGTESVPLSRMRLRLQVGAVPSLALLLKERHDAGYVKAAIVGNDRATVSWQDQKLVVLPFAAAESGGSSGTNEATVHALLLTESLESWLTTTPAAPPEIQYGIYQHQSDAGGWEFLNNCLAHQVLVPPKGFRERIDQLLPVGSCLPRPIRQDNQQYVSTVTGFLQRDVPELMGWCAVHAEREALRFIFFDEANAFELDESWEGASDRAPLRFASGRDTHVEVRKTGLQVESGKNMALLMELARHGMETPLSGFLAAGEESELVYAPGTVKLGEHVLMCEAVTYTFSAESDALATSLSLSHGHRTPARAVFSTRCEGLFRAWDADDEKQARVFLATPDDTTWQMMDATDSNLLDPSMDLMAEFLLPTTPSASFSGMYVRRVDGDRVIFKMEGFRTPIIYGSHQVLSEKLEAATVAVNTEILGLSSSKKETGINDVRGIVANAKTLLKRTDSEIQAEAPTITLANNVEVENDALGINSKTDVAGSATMRKVKVTGVPGMAVVMPAQLSYPIQVMKQGAQGVPAVAASKSVASGAPGSSESLEPDVVSASWGSSVARRGEALKLFGNTYGYPDGTAAVFKIYELDHHGAESFVAQLDGSLTSNAAGVKWSFEYTRDVWDLPHKHAGDPEYRAPWYVFDFEVAGKSARSGTIEFRDTLGLTIENHDSEPIANTDLTVYFADGSWKHVRTDERGQAELVDVPPGRVTVELGVPRVDGGAGADPERVPEPTEPAEPPETVPVEEPEQEGVTPAPPGPAEGSPEEDGPTEDEDDCDKVVFPSGESLCIVTDQPMATTDDEHWDAFADRFSLTPGPLLDCRGKGDVKLSDNFTVNEFTKGAPYARIDPDLVEKLQSLRSVTGPLTITSGYRSWEYNKAIYAKRNKTPTKSPHTHGIAADIRVAGLSAVELAEKAIDAFGCHMGVGLIMGAATIHVDTRTRWTIWPYDGAASAAAKVEVESYRNRKC